MVTVKVPATSANLGSGFDSVGIALQLYNTINAEETDNGLKIDILDDTSKFLPHDGRNLVYRAMQAVFDEVGYCTKGIHIVQSNRIPVTRGLGSSSASIVGGLIAANEISGGFLDKDRLITLAAQIEGHPDNTTPAITGGMSIAVLDEKVHHIDVRVNANHLSFVLFIPDFILRTKKARSVLPRTIPHSDGVYNTGRAALLSAAMLTEQYDHLKTALQDRLHQPYRKRLIQGVGEIFKKSEEYGCLGTYISGAGPTVISIVRLQHIMQFEKEMSLFLENNMPNWQMMILKPDNLGARIISH